MPAYEFRGEAFSTLSSDYYFDTSIFIWVTNFNLINWNLPSCLTPEKILLVGEKKMNSAESMRKEKYEGYTNKYSLLNVN